MKEKTACRYQHINLKCKKGNVHIVRAEYGRRSKNVCAWGVPKTHKSIANTNCGDAPAATKIMRQKCEGKKGCSVFAPGTLGDPCPGINKYTVVNYTCVEEQPKFAQWGEWSKYGGCSVSCGQGVKIRRRDCESSWENGRGCSGISEEQATCLMPPCQDMIEKTTCRNQPIKLQCDRGQLQIVRAEFGRRSKSVCAYGVPKNSKSIANTNCGDAPTATAIMKKKCEGKTACSVFAPGTLGDPCPGINKYTVVNYTCVEDSRRAMWSVWSDLGECSVTCGQGVRTRRRQCVSPSPQVPQDCAGSEEEQEPCVKQVCPSENEQQGTYCHNETIALSCAKGKLSIVNAEYGRRSKTICSVQSEKTGIIYNKALSNTKCGDMKHTTAVMKEKCEGKDSCSVFGPTMFKDPCPDTNKYTVVNYTCKE